MNQRCYELRYLVGETPWTEVWHASGDASPSESARHTERQWRRVLRTRPEAVFVGLICSMAAL